MNSPWDAHKEKPADSWLKLHVCQFSVFAEQHQENM